MVASQCAEGKVRDKVSVNDVTAYGYWSEPFRFPVLIGVDGLFLLKLRRYNALQLGRGLNWDMNRKISSAPTRRSPDLPQKLETLAPVDVRHMELGHTIQDSRVFDMDISGHHFSSLRFMTCLLERVSFARCTIGSCRFRDVRLERCDLSNAVLRGSEATRIELIDCRLTGLKAIECRWRDVLIENCDARYAQFTDGAVIVSEFKMSQFQDADFRNAALNDGIFVQASLTRADLSGAKLRNVDLRGADISEATFRINDVYGAIVSPVQAMELSRLLGVLIR